MIPRRNIPKRPRKTRPGVEWLDDRVVLSAGATQAAAEATRFQAAVVRLEGRFQSGLNHLNAVLNNRIAHFDARDQAAFSRAAGQMGSGATPAARTAAAALQRSVAAVAGDFNRFAAGLDRQWNQSARNFDRQLNQVGHRYAQADPALQPAVDALKRNLQAAEAAISGRLGARLQAERANLQSVNRSAGAVIAAVRPAGSATAGASALNAASQIATSGLTAGIPGGGTSSSTGTSLAGTGSTSGFDIPNGIIVTPSSSPGGVGGPGGGLGIGIPGHMVPTGIIVTPGANPGGDGTGVDLEIGTTGAGPTLFESGVTTLLGAPGVGTPGFSTPGFSTSPFGTLPFGTTTMATSGLGSGLPNVF
jgi:hypothetical protein